MGGGGNGKRQRCLQTMTTNQRTRRMRQEVGVQQEVEAPVVERQWRYEMQQLTREPEHGKGQRCDERLRRRQTGSGGGDISGPKGDCCTVIARMVGGGRGGEKGDFLKI
jgi:hypothetical protein